MRYRLGADVDGHRIDIPGVMWFGVRDGLITRRIDTWDSLTFFRQTDQDPPPAEPRARRSRAVGVGPEDHRSPKAVVASSTGVRMRNALIVANRTVGGE